MEGINKHIIFDKLSKLNVTYEELNDILESNRKKTEYIINHEGLLVHNNEKVFIGEKSLLEADSLIKYLIYDCKIKIEDICKINECLEEEYLLPYLTNNISEKYFVDSQNYKLWLDYIKNSNISIAISMNKDTEFIEFQPYSLLSYSEIYALVEIFDMIPFGSLVVKLGDDEITRIVH